MASPSVLPGMNSPTPHRYQMTPTSEFNEFERTKLESENGEEVKDSAREGGGGVEVEEKRKKLQRRKSQPNSNSESWLKSLNTPNQLIFLGLIITQMIVVFALILVIFLDLRKGSYVSSFKELSLTPRLQSTSTYLAVFVLAQLFIFITSIDSLHQRNSQQLVFLLPFQLAIIAYGGVLPSQLSQAISGTAADQIRPIIQALSIAIPCVIALITILMGVFIYRLQGEFGWKVFKLVTGASIQLRKHYQLYQFYLSILKFAAFFYLGFTVQFLILVTDVPNAEKIITIIALPLTLLILATAGIWVRYEIKEGLIAFMVMQVIGVAYFVFKIVRIFIDSSYDVAHSSLLIFGVISLLLLIGNFILSVILYGKFGQGLKEAIPPYAFGMNSNRVSDPEGSGQEHDDRMSLD